MATNKPQSVANLSPGPRSLHVLGADGKTIEQVTLMPGEARDLVLANPDGVIEQSWLKAGELWVGKPGTAPAAARAPGADDNLAMREASDALAIATSAIEALTADLQTAREQNAAQATLIQGAETRATEAEVDAAEKGEQAARLTGEVTSLKAEVEALKAAAATKATK